MSTDAKADLHRLIEELPESEVHAVRRYLELVASKTLAAAPPRSGFSDEDLMTDPMLARLMAAPEEDEPTTTEEDESVLTGLAEYRRGDYVSSENAKRRD